MFANPHFNRTVCQALLIGVVACSSISCQPPAPPPGPPPAPLPKVTEQTVQAVPDVSEVTEGEIVAFCSGCHAMPQPKSFPKEAWPHEVKRGFAFYDKFKPPGLIPPAVDPVIEYFHTRAPSVLDTPDSTSLPGPASVRFRVEEVHLGDGAGALWPIAVSFLSLWKQDQHSRRFLLSDMANGGVWMVDSSTSARCLTRVGNPAVASRCDLNTNGIPDLVIADLGSFPPMDHNLGAVFWLKDVDEKATLRKSIPLVRGLGRVADVQPADFDSDGDVDLVVAEFGWHTTGRILLLQNDGNRDSPSFDVQVIDPRPGTIHVPVVDLNRDGHPDFVALISQQFEVIEAFLNKGDGTFEKQTIHAAGDPAYGSSGIQVIDLDRDGDDDVLLTNGDIFDSFLIKPYQGVQWLENTGTFPFRLHRLTSFPGVHRALAGDLDGDGDLDIVAAAMFPSTVRDSQVGRKSDSLIWLEQTPPGEFVRHTLESGRCVHATLELADLDGDGDLEIITGTFALPGSSSSDSPVATIWWNGEE